MKIFTPVIAWIKKQATKKEPPVLVCQYGTVTESARRTAALIMRVEPKKREEVIERCMLIMNLPRHLAEEEVRRRYPEAWQ